MQAENVIPEPKTKLGVAAVGVAMGAADVVPGVSGGTMAFIFGVYAPLLQSIKSFDLALIRLVLRGRFADAFRHVNGGFLLPLAIGLGTALLSLAHLISWLLDNHPIPLFAFFFGLVLASIVAVSGHVRWTPALALTGVIGAVVAYQIVRLVPLNMPNDPLTLFLCASVAIMAMILPGISGSFILFILGQYKFVLDAVKSFDIVALIPFAAGAAFGLLAFVRVLLWLLRRYHQQTVTVLVGFMIGSLWKIWPFRETLETVLDPKGHIVPLRERLVLPDFGSGLFGLSLALALFGLVLISVLDHCQTGRNPLMRLLRRTPQTTADGREAR